MEYTMDDLRGKKILVVDDDPMTRHLVARVLGQEGCAVHIAQDGQEGLRQFYTLRPDLVILDVSMPRMDGWQVLNAIRQLSDVPILMLTGQIDEDNVVQGLERGADDYLCKPVSPKVLRARVRAVWRRIAQTSVQSASSNYEDDYLTVDLTARRVLINRQAVKLSAKELGVLTYLVENAGRVLTYRQILERVWGWEYQNDTDYVRVYIAHLRQKLEPDPKEPRYLLTEHGIGYRFNVKA
jgi:DNA-binding response OmpR family regulator